MVDLAKSQQVAAEFDTQMSVHRELSRNNIMTSVIQTTHSTKICVRFCQIDRDGSRLTTPFAKLLSLQQNKKPIVERQKLQRCKRSGLARWNSCIISKIVQTPSVYVMAMSGCCSGDGLREWDLDKKTSLFPVATMLVSSHGQNKENT